MKIILHPLNNPPIEDVQLHISWCASSNNEEACEDAMDTFLTKAENVVIGYRTSPASPASTLVSMTKGENGDIILEINKDNCNCEIPEN